MWCRSAPWSSASDSGCAVKAGQAGTGRGFVSTCQARECSWPWREFALLEAPASFFASCHATVRRCTEEDGVYRMRDTPKRLRQISNSPPRCAGRRRRRPSPSWFLNGFLESAPMLRRGRVVAAKTRETQAMLSRIPSPSDVAARVAVSARVTPQQGGSPSSSVSASGSHHLRYRVSPTGIQGCPVSITGHISLANCYLASPIGEGRSPSEGNQSVGDPLFVDPLRRFGKRVGGCEGGRLG